MPDGLAVQGYHFAICRIVQSLTPSSKALSKSLRVEYGEQPAESIVAWYAVGQFQILSQPLFLGLTELLHIREALTTADYRAHRDKENVDQEMLLGTVRPWIRQDREVNEEVSRLTHRQVPPALGRVILATSSTDSKVPVLQ